ncbi:unnamed protein product, partial [Choristocarpus tenellus]
AGLSGGDAKFEVLSARNAYSGWRNIVKKDIRMPSGNIATFDVVDQAEPSVAVFVWHTRSKTLTLIKEYAPGRESMMHGVVAGMYEVKKHAGPLEAAKFELEEEAHLTGGTWHSLTESLKTTVSADKYSTNEFFCWLCVDPEVTTTPRPLDAEEFIEIERGIALSEAMGMIVRGEMSVVSGFVTMLAMEKLQNLGLLAR